MQKLISKPPSGRAGELQMNKENSSLKDQVKRLKKKVEDIDRRLKKLENPGKKTSNSKKNDKKNNPNKKNSGNRKKGEISTDHKYLKRTIKDAKKRYEREHKL